MADFVCTLPINETGFHETMLMCCLYSKVMEARTDQIEDRMQQVKERQEESLKHREELLRELEIANQLTRRDVAKAEDDKLQLKLELKQQVSQT